MAEVHAPRRMKIVQMLIYGLKTVIETFYTTIAKGTTGTTASNIRTTRENEKNWAANDER